MYLVPRLIFKSLIRVFMCDSMHSKIRRVTYVKVFCMKQLFLMFGFLFVSFSALANFVSPIDFNELQKDEVVRFVKANAEEKWRDDHSMVNYEFKKQMNAFKWLISNANDSKILDSAVRKWREDGDYSMIKYEYNKQYDAKNTELNW